MSAKLREITQNDLEVVFNAHLNGRNSYALLHAMLGYSLSELKSEYGSSTRPPYKELIVEDGAKPLGLIRLGPEDSVSKTVRLQPFMVSAGGAEEEGLSQCVADVMDQMMLYNNISRFYCFLLETETAEAGILRQNGFDVEAVLRGHVYLQGEYENLLILGKNFGGMR